MENNLPLISIIIPVYNVEPYLRQCLDSVTGQTYRNLEVLIIDDGSSDGSSSICDEYALTDDRVKVFHKDNQGISAARNYGLDHRNESAEYIAFLDSDDWMNVETIQVLYEEVSRIQADIGCCLYYYEYTDSRIPSVKLEETVVLEGDQITKALTNEYYLSNVAWNKLYKADLFATLRYPDGRLYEDVSTTHKLILAADRVVVVPIAFIHYRVRSGSISHSHSMNVLCDRWQGYYGKYRDLSVLAKDPVGQKRLIGDCLNVVSAMWRWYSCFSHSEKQEASSTLDEMQTFVDEHYSEIMCDPGYSKKHKSTALFARSRNPVFMKILNLTTQLLLFLISGKSNY